MTKTVHCIRHGQSTFNAAFALNRVDPLHWDAPLTELGQQQAREAAAQLRDIPSS
jgi:broad specificity phosphatase PhoE